MIEFEWKPDKTAKTPIYRQIVKYISDKIARRGLGDRQPPAIPAGNGFGF